MKRSRRFLPSISLLAAFDAVFRTGSTAAAARELDLSQGAVSRLVQSLEAQLGRPLFVRQRRRLLPTDAAHVYAGRVSRALDLIQRASMEFIANPGGGALSLAILPAFGSRWLAPRLGRFSLAHPGVTINLATRLRPFSFTTENFDAAIHFGSADWPDAEHMKLFDEHLTACIAPALLARHPVAGVDDMAGLPLLQIETRPGAWGHWFAAQGGRAPQGGGMLVDQFAPMIQAAIAGLGVALLPHYLAAPELEEGRLVPLLRTSVAGSGSYWLAWPVSRSSHPPLLAFRAWLAGELSVGDQATLRI